MSVADTKFELCHDVEQVLKIGRDFQKQDSWRGAHHDTTKLLCDTIEYLREQSNAQIGNAAAIREAAKEFVSVILDKKPGIHNLHRLAEKCRDALAKPPRNCDRKFADHPTMYYEFRDWCHKKGHTIEPLLASDAFDWFLETTEEGASCR